jgi:hypothetical protein
MRVPTPPDLPTWRRVRRYAVPPTMIAEATEARLAGDWPAALAAARMDSDVDLSAVAREHGPRAADRIAEDLTHFAPDLLRWHMPRHLGGRTGISPRFSAVLAPGPTADGPLLQVLPPTIVTGSQRLRLRVVTLKDLGRTRFYDAPRHTWDARRAVDLRHAWGGSDRRPPMLAPDATPVPEARLGTGADRAAWTERILGRLAEGEVVEAWREAGIELDPTEPPRQPWAEKSAMELLRDGPVWLAGLADEVERLSTLYRLESVMLFHEAWYGRVLLRVDDGRVVANFAGTEGRPHGRPELSEAVWRHPADLHLLRLGMLRPDDLHPLVHASLFPDLPPPAPSRAATVAAPEAVRVHCRGAWHWVRVVNGRIHAVDHTEEEERSEQMLRALGGTSSGCFAALQAWTEGTGRLPKRLRQARDDLLQRIFHGDTEYVRSMWEAGYVDARMRDARGWTLLHMLLYLDPEPLLSLLLASGLPIDVREATGRTPLHVAVGNDGSPALARALYDAGADPTAADEWDGGIQELLDLKENPELEFLRQEADA